MAKRVQRRRGTTAEHGSFKGAEGEITVDTTMDTLRVHDNEKMGGHILAKADGSNITDNSIGISALNVTDGSAGWFLQTDGNNNLSFAAVDVGGTALGGSKLGGTIANATIDANAVGISELAVTEAGGGGSAGHFLRTDGSGTLSFAEVVTDPGMGGMLGGITSNATINSNVITEAMLTTSLKNFTIDTGTGASGVDTFNLSAAPGSVNSILVYIDGIVQPPSAYVLLTSPNRIQFVPSGPPVGAVIRMVHLGFQSTVGTPSDGSVTNAKLAANAVTTDKILDLTIATGDIADDAITEAKIDAQTITNASITPNTIRNQEIANATITSTEIASNAVDGTKINLAGNVQGDIMYYDQTNTWVRLGPGTTGHVLTTVGANGNPYWAAGSSGTALPGVGSVGDVLTNVGGTWTAVTKGDLVKIHHHVDNAYKTGTAAFPFNSTVPTISEGDEYMRFVVTPVSATSTLLIDVTIQLSVSSADNVGAGLFELVSTNCLVANSHIAEGGSPRSQFQIRMIYQVASANTTARTYTVRAGQDGGNGDCFYNGSDDVTRDGKFGGNVASTITVTEYEA